MIRYKYNSDIIIEKSKNPALNSDVELKAPFFFSLQFHTPLNGDEIAQWSADFWNDIDGQKVNQKNRTFTIPLPDQGQAMTTEDLRQQFFQVCPELAGAEKVTAP